jgi:hypothetical protein
MGIVLVQASIYGFNNRSTKTATTNIITVLPFGAGTTPNGNTILHLTEFFRDYLTVRNIRNLFVPGATDLLYYSYSDDATMLVDGFPLAPGEAFDIESPQTIYAASATGNTIPVAIDQGISIG